MRDNREESSKTWYKKQEKKEKQQVQNTLSPKSEAKHCTRKCQQSQEYE